MGTKKSRLDDVMRSDDTTTTATTTMTDASAITITASSSQQQQPPQKKRSRTATTTKTSTTIAKRQKPHVLLMAQFAQELHIFGLKNNMKERATAAEMTFDGEEEEEDQETSLNVKKCLCKAMLEVDGESWLDQDVQLVANVNNTISVNYSAKTIICVSAD